MVEQASVVRAAIIVAAAALLEAVLGPYLTFGYVSPKFALIGIVFAVSPCGTCRRCSSAFSAASCSTP